MADTDTDTDTDGTRLMKMLTVAGKEFSANESENACRSLLILVFLMKHMMSALLVVGMELMISA